MPGISALIKRIEDFEAVDRLAKPMQRLAGRMVHPRVVRNVLSGTNLGHPLHPTLTDVPIGTWLGAALLWEFDVTSGNSINPFGQGLQPYPVRVIDGHVEIDVGPTEIAAARPNIRISKLSAADVITPERVPMMPAGAGITCWPRMTSGFSNRSKRLSTRARPRTRSGGSPRFLK